MPYNCRGEFFCELFKLFPLLPFLIGLLTLTLYFYDIFLSIAYCERNEESSPVLAKYIFSSILIGSFFLPIFSLVSYFLPNWIVYTELIISSNIDFLDLPCCIDIWCVPNGPKCRRSWPWKIGYLANLFND